MRLSVRRTDPSRRCHRHDCEGTSSRLGMAGLFAWPCTWPRWSVDIDVDLEGLSMDPRRSPQRIGNVHLADKLAYLRRYSWSATTAPRLPPPVRSEPGAVPFNHGLRLHDRQGADHLRSQPIQAGEYQTVQHPERRPFRRLPPQHVKLMTQNRVFSLKRDPRLERSDQRQPN